MGEKVDYKKELKELYMASAKSCSIIVVPAMKFLMIEGKGNPNDSLEFQNAVEALFSVSYTLKFMIKKSASIDYGVMPLEGLWWCDDMEKFSVENKDIWKWKLMIMQPSHITRETFSEAAEHVSRKKSWLLLIKLALIHMKREKLPRYCILDPFQRKGQPLRSFMHLFWTINIR